MKSDKSPMVVDADSPRPASAWPLLLALVGLVVATVLMILASPARAADEALYGPTAPPGSAYLRVFNATHQPLAGAQIGNQRIPSTAAAGASDFVFLPPGRHELITGGLSQSVEMASGRAYTAVVADAGIQILEAGRFDNRLKALVMFYNLTDEAALTLRTADGGTEVVGTTPAPGLQSREVNPVNVDFAVFDGDRKLADAPPVQLQRGRVFSLFAVDMAGRPSLQWVVN